MDHLFDMTAAPIELSAMLATGTAWSANGVMYESPRDIIASTFGFGPSTLRIVVEPNYFALAAALNLAAAYHPHWSEPC